MKQLSDKIKQKEEELKLHAQHLSKAVAKIPNLSWDDIPL
jgi:seryl-tRNA synthetase